jgi:hypothetical protein
MGSSYTSIEDAKAKMRTQINAELDTAGVWQGTTCPTGAPWGWDMNAHYALEWFQRHRPDRWHIARIYKFECYDWTITVW